MYKESPIVSEVQQIPPVDLQEPVLPVSQPSGVPNPEEIAQGIIDSGELNVAPEPMVFGVPRENMTDQISGLPKISPESQVAFEQEVQDEFNARNFNPSAAPTAEESKVFEKAILYPSDETPNSYGNILDELTAQLNPRDFSDVKVIDENIKQLRRNLQNYNKPKYKDAYVKKGLSVYQMMAKHYSNQINELIKYKEKLLAFSEKVEAQPPEKQQETVWEYEKRLEEEIREGKTMAGAITVKESIEITDINGDKKHVFGPFTLWIMDNGDIKIKDTVDVTVTKAEFGRMFAQVNEAGERKVQVDQSNISMGGLTPEARRLYDKIKSDGDGNPIKEDYGGYKFRAKALLTLWRWQSYLTRKDFQDVLQQNKFYLGKERSEKWFEKARTIDLKDEIVSRLFTDKEAKQQASDLGWTMVQPIHKILWDTVVRDMPGAKQAQLQEKYFKLVKYLGDANEEIFTNDVNKISTTGVGLGGPHYKGTFSDTAEMDAFVERMKEFSNDFGIPFTDKDIEQWKAGRPEKCFFNLLAHPAVCSDDTLQRALILAKVNLENPQLARQLELGIFDNANMAEGIKEGFHHRLWTKQDIQKPTIDNIRSSFGSASQPSAKYRTYQEYLLATKAQDLKPIDSYTASLSNYIANSLLTVQQVQTVNWLKSLATINEPGLKYVMYENSPEVVKGAKKEGLTPNAYLVKKGYIQDKQSPGLAEWYRKAFNDPYLHRDVYDLIRTMYAPKGENPAESLSKSSYYWKRWITINPFDSTGLFITPALLYTPAELVSAAWKGAPSLVTTGKEMLAGKYDPAAVRTDMPFIDLFIKHGWTAANFEQAAKSIWDKEELGRYPELMSPLDNQLEFAASAGGANTAIFNNIVSKSLYAVTEKFFERFLTDEQVIEQAKKEGIGVEDVAARRAVTLVNDMAFMLNSNVWGKHGSIWNLSLFTRNLTAGLVRQVTAASYDVMKRMGVPLDKIHKYHTGRFSQLMNVFTHGEISASDLDFLSGYYFKHIAKFMAVKLLAIAAIQYALVSLFGGSDKDKNILNNEPGKKLQIWTPFKDPNNRRYYIDMQVLREARQIADILPASVGWGAGPAKLITGRINPLVTKLFELVQNKDFSGNEILPKDLGPGETLESFSKWLTGDMFIPLGLRKEEWKLTGDPKIDMALGGLGLVGFQLRKGMALEEGASAEDQQKMNRAVALYNFKAKKSQEKAKEMFSGDVPGLAGPYFGKEAVKSTMRRKMRPQAEFFRRNRRKIILEEEE
jgi:hypothetical protein